MAIAAPYKVNWLTGVNLLLFGSIGMGNAPKARPGLDSDDLWLLDHAKDIPSARMNAASAGLDMTCRMLGECRVGAKIDRKFGDMHMPPMAVYTIKNTGFAGRYLLGPSESIRLVEVDGCNDG